MRWIPTVLLILFSATSLSAQNRTQVYRILTFQTGTAIAQFADPIRLEPNASVDRFL